MKNAGRYTATAPATAPAREPRPPITGMASSTSDDSGRTRSTEMVRHAMPHNTPAMATNAPDTARIDSFTVAGTTPKLETARSLSRTATTRRPGRLRRNLPAATSVIASRASAA